MQRTAVLAPIVQRAEPMLVLIRRADRGDPWSNHIAFPGGHIEEADTSDLAAAFRETGEELGVGQDDIAYLGSLGHFPVQTLTVDLHAFVGFWNGQGGIRPDPAEVARVYEVALSDLLEQNHSLGWAGRTAAQLGRRLEYRLEDAVAWGVTARIIHRLLEVIGPVLE
ncbi:MAG: NUDIX hydrolase [Phycisphaerae bacterium]